uniref:Arm DNA-binding domain-containing protein n=1 Tax=Ningiella ruwaisensis TaxID=2364274 RepID=UPI0019D5A559|nr:Arm DNA-binding domain-containing protein [Ningiella ruwaisensis]
MGKLNARKVAALAKDEPRKTADGNGLYFVVPASGEPFWILRFSINGSRPEMTLGSYPELSLADARDAAFQQRKLSVLNHVAVRLTHLSFSKCT